MANFVIKKDGTKVPFDAEKIKSAVMAAASQAGVAEDAASDTAQKVVDAVSMAFSGQEETPTSEIKEKVLSELDAIAPDVSASWRKYDESMGK
ncbi:MAG: ATP cone domain-containing protein [Candidatus Staskawiczbacteria bacterium]|jgi:transcriptional regulator NrdR family protein